MNFDKVIALLVCLVGFLIISCKPAPISYADCTRWFSLNALSEKNMIALIDERDTHAVARFVFSMSPEEYSELVKSAISHGYSQPVQRGGSFGTFDESASDEDPIWEMENRLGKVSKFIFYKNSKNEVTAIIFWD